MTLSHGPCLLHLSVVFLVGDVKDLVALFAKSRDVCGVLCLKGPSQPVCTAAVRLLLLSSGRLDIFHSTNDMIRADLPWRVRSTCNLSVTV